jgi:hypothetical protein
VYDGNQMIETLDQYGSMQNRYLWGPGVDQLLAQTDASGTVLWALTDYQNTIHDWINFANLDPNNIWADPAPAIVDHIVYDVYGNVTGHTDGSGNAISPVVNSLFGYTGRFFDSLAGLQWNGQAGTIGRWYDPLLGSFVNQGKLKKLKD